jgi:hypothetical protein
MYQHIASVFGTRPEAIKLFPVIYALRERTNLRISVLVTGQHRAMLDQVLAVADIRPDIDLNIMLSNQTLDGLTARLTGSGWACSIGLTWSDIIKTQQHSMSTQSIWPSVGCIRSEAHRLANFNPILLLSGKTMNRRCLR